MRMSLVFSVSFNLLKTKRYLLYTHSPTTVIKTNQLIMYKAKVDVCSEIRTEHTMQSEHHVQFLKDKPCGT